MKLLLHSQTSTVAPDQSKCTTTPAHRIYQRVRNTNNTWSLYLTHCNLVIPYGYLDISQHLFRWCLVTWWYQTIAWNNGSILSTGSLGANFREMLNIHNFFHSTPAFENVKKAATLSRPQCVYFTGDTINSRWRRKGGFRGGAPGARPPNFFQIRFFITILYKGALDIQYCNKKHIWHIYLIEIYIYSIIIVF